MLKIKVSLGKSSKLYEFAKNPVIIGGLNSPMADILIKGEDIREEHLAISLEEGKYFVINKANDPLVALNDLPFHKKELTPNDSVSVGKYSISILSAADKEELTDDLEKIEADLTEKEVEEADIDDLIKEVEFAEEWNAEREQKKEASTYYVNDFDDESENWNQEAEKENRKQLLTEIKSYALLFLSLIAICAFILSGVYYRENDKNSQEEKKIAAGIADIAMAMNYSKIYHLFPNKHNWTDPNFIRNNLTFVLAPGIHTQAQINDQGQFYKYPYILRVYVSANNSDFLVLAQPSSNLLHWFAYKKSLVIDSRAMEIRKLADIKELNRLLANPKPLEGQNGEEIYRVVKSGDLMPISSLAGIRNRWGFTPPKALSYIREKAENYIYNAPRYYPFGETILNRAVQLYDTQTSNLEVIELKEEMEEIARFPDMVLYTSRGLNYALKAQKALTTFVPNGKFLIAYVRFDNAGTLTGSNLLIDENRDEDIEEEIENGEAKTGLSHEAGSDFPDAVDNNHPLFLQLLALKKDRYKTLKPLGNEISLLITKNNQTVDPLFNDKLARLFNNYKKAEKRINRKIENEIKNLYDEHSDIPYEKFISLIENSGLTPLLAAALQIAENPANEKIDQLIARKLRKVEKAPDISKLEKILREAIGLVNIQRLANINLLIRYQNLIHNAVMRKIAGFLFSPDSPYAKQPPSEKEREAFYDILQMTWITDDDERDYFTEEFALLLSNHYQTFAE